MAWSILVAMLIDSKVYKTLLLTHHMFRRKQTNKRIYKVSLVSLTGLQSCYGLVYTVPHFCLSEKTVVVEIITGTGIP